MSKQDKQAATDKYRQAGKDMKNAKTEKEWLKASDDLIDAQHEGLPKRFSFGKR
jgi:hypothetical protein